MTMSMIIRDKEHGPTWWYKILSRVMPGRCREIPHAQDTKRILIRQFAIVKRYVYLQQFASGEGKDHAHSHSWPWGTIAIGLSGFVQDYRHLTGTYSEFHAPYIRYMSADHIHATVGASRGHTSIFIGLGIKNDFLKNYFQQINWRGTDEQYGKGCVRTSWRRHILKKVKRI